MKKIILSLALLALVGAGCTKVAQAPEQEQNSAGGGQTYDNTVRGYSFDYPSELHLTEDAVGVTLNHNVAFQNYGDCDMKGEGEIYSRLNDFNTVIKLVNKPLAAAVKAESSYMPGENFTPSGLKVTPGFIDQYQAGNLKGYSIYEGAEGCGRTIYYFPVKPNQTLVVTKDSVQLLSTAIAKEKQDQLLAVPGVINNQQAEHILKQVLSTFKLTK